MSTVEELDAEIHKICDSLVEEANAISQLAPVSHRSKSRIRFEGGIFGAIREHREGKRLDKLMNIPIYKDWNFCDYAFHLIDTAETLVQKQLEIQRILTEDDARYYGNVDLIRSCVTTARNAWYEYSPDMAMDIGYEDAPVIITINAHIGEEFKKLHSRQSTQEPDSGAKNGCFGIILLLVISGVCVAII